MDQPPSAAPCKCFSPIFHLQQEEEENDDEEDKDSGNGSVVEFSSEAAATVGYDIRLKKIKDSDRRPKDMRAAVKTETSV